ncbi:hypothetical protein SLEP1_g31514 [Rubroshorea leprosula]|uniref:Retrovirus-related Pol polyprotein from transposon RE1 n=1 Tax=Rubroshorea leprosula TaxID=152421 RepID=A0AAV5K3J2_9ROSI|nr:hypothetical protein SLEP1_g31514 [Rubroshorea leprosula]
MSSNNSSTLSNPPMFTGENYSVWAIKMKAFLKGNGVWESVEDGFHPPMLPNNPTVAQMKQHADYVQASYKALSYIHNAVTDDIFSRIMGAKIAQEAWDTLKKEFDGSSWVEDRRVVEKIIVSVPDKFESKISAIEESCDLKELTITELISKLQAHEQRLVMKTDETTEGAFLARQKGKQPATSSESNKTMGFNQAYQHHQQSRKWRFPPCCHCRKTNHEEKDCWFKGKSQIQCRFCKKYGHFEKNCRDQCKEDYLFTMSHGSSLPSSSWFVDSGCTNHMARDENFFIEMDKSVITNVKLENGTVVRSQGKGTAVIQTKTERKNRTVMEMARCMLAEKKLPKCFWAEAVYTAVYLLNGLPTKAVKGITPIEAWYGQKPSADQLRVFGSICYNHVPAAKRGKLDEKVEIGIFIGYATEAKGYKVYDPISKKVPRAWYCRIDDYLMSQGFRRSTEEATLYVKGSSSESQLILSLYVDDLLLIGNDLKLMEQFKKVMMQEFAMTNLGETKYFLGLEVQQLSKGNFICQRKYAVDILKKFEMESCKPVATPLVQYEKLSKDDRETKVDSSYYRSLIGSLLYLTATRPDLMFVASYLSRFMSAPSKLHLVATKRVLRYIKGTYELGLWFDSNQQGRLQGYADSDWAGSMEDMISTIGYVFSFGSGSFSWNSKKQDVEAQSTAKAEYLAAGAAANHAIWLRMVLEELGFDQMEPCVLKVDNMSAIAIAQNPMQHGRTKRIKIKYHVIRNYVRDKEIVLQHCDSEIQVADILTKALPKQKFEEFRIMLGVTNIKSKEEC